MKKFCYFLMVAILTSGMVSADGWPDEKVIKSKKYKEVVTLLGDLSKPDKYPMYPKGLEGVNKLIKSSLKYPVEAMKQGITGKVIISYEVGADGNVMHTKVIQSIHPLLDNAALDVIHSMDRWVPAYKNGKPMPVYFTQPFNFNL